MKRSLLLSVFLTGFNIGFAQSYGDYAVKVDVAGNGFAHQTIVYFDDESWSPDFFPTYGWDGCCDALLVLGNSNQPQIFTQVVAPPAPLNNHRLSINGLPHLFEQTDVPLGFLPGTLAQYTFNFTELYTLPIGVTVELEDLTQNVTQDLLLDSSYVTWGAVSDDEERFILHFYPANVTSIDSRAEFGSRIIVKNHSGGLSIAGLADCAGATVRLLDALGNVVWTKQLLNGMEDLLIELNAASKGIYILEFISPKNERKAVKVWF